MHYYTGRNRKTRQKKIIMLLQCMIKIVKMIWLVKNLRNILMSKNSQKQYFEKSHYVLIYIYIFICLRK